ncbi:helix-turn-helix transcriptional regulator [Anaerotalea alkaliphila]|uniref:Helix-turn-helix transcriptional regulator n=1 Tax=Anaerotalea alkaliphila TaxID=2662126 RepID=A0A7X5KLR4_9FIRM|nr:AraC family transcriptional regulator [Anaerotalea alkaliphila]NDL67096.1 helix-turn-helix transcriptional regulator [Anaerotalea alkaliphila]
MHSITHLITNGFLDLDTVEGLAHIASYALGLPIRVYGSHHEPLLHLSPDPPAAFEEEPAAEELFHFMEEAWRREGNGIFTYRTQGPAYLLLLFSNAQTFWGSLVLGPFPQDKQRHLALYRLLERLFLAPWISKTVERHEHALHDLPTFPLSPAPYPYESERLILTKISTGDTDRALHLFQEHLRPYFLTQFLPEQLGKARSQACAVCSLFSRAAMEGGLEPEAAYLLEDHCFTQLEEASTLEDLPPILSKSIARFSGGVFMATSVNHVSVIKKASRYVHSHLSETIRLEDVAEHVELSSNYFSSLFKREMHMAFADYVNLIRVKESKYLLQRTNATILEVALAVGYSNQNYFTTIFKKFTGITPKQYRMRTSG